ncbi:unnamed protein product [Linum tenue]|uniref:Uncharacterized protein n=1 Tax=Linum tenue TaxID=586396 RepID=A0AAV0MR71_9ROSI|nr:unnamed protein product [Linum tenue]
MVPANTSQISWETWE